MRAAQINAFGGADVLGSMFWHLYLSGGNLAECFMVAVSPCWKFCVAPDESMRW
jgi:hypothetical protein